MATTTSESSKEFPLFQQIQRKTTKFMQKEGELDLVVNGRYSRIGGIEKISGYERVGNTITTSSTTTSTSTSSSTSTSTSTSSTTTA